MRFCGQCGAPESEAAARYCRQCGSALPLSPAAPDTRVVVSVVRCDVVGSTSMGEHHDPEFVRRVMALYYETARQALERHGGILERFVGDAVIAIFGLPMPREDDAIRAVQAAAELRDRLAELNRELERDGFSLRVRTAVETGEIVAGLGGAGQLIATGDVMNVVTRLEEAAPPGEILIGEATWRLLRELVEVENLEPLTLKGKRDPVVAYRLLAILPDASRHARALEVPLIGRDPDQAVLHALQARVVETGTCHLVTIFGAAGIGKSRLAEEFVRAVGPRSLVLRGRCLAYGGVAYDPIVQMIAQAAEIDLGKREQVHDRLAVLVAEDEHAARIIERVEQLLDLRRGTSPPEDTRWALRRLLEILAAKRPLLIVLEDLHLAEPTLLDLVEDIVESLRNTPLLLVCLARTDLLDTRRRWAGGKVGVTSIQLTPLGQDDVRQLVTHLLGEVPAAPEVQTYIAEQAGGNPLFVQTLVRTLREGGSLRLNASRDEWQAATDLAALGAPPDMQAFLRTRIANLRPEERQVIERAAVIGRQFSVDAVIDLSPAEERRNVRANLRALARKQLIVPSGKAVLIPLGREETYSFPHSPIREAAYEGIRREVRADLHARYADWLRTAGRQELPQVDEFIGHHLEQAHDNLVRVGRSDERVRRLARQAGEALAAAGHRAAARGDIPEAAVSLLERAVGFLVDNDQVRRTALLGLAAELSASGQPSRSMAVYREVAAAAEQAGDLGRATHAKLGLLAVRWFNGFAGMASEGDAEVEHALTVFNRLDDDLGLARAWRLQAHVHWAMGRLGQAREASETAIELAQRAGDERLEARGVSTHCSVLLAGPWPVEEVERYCNQALQWARTRGLRSLQADVLRVLAQTQAMRGRFDPARELLRQASRIDVVGQLDDAAGYPSDLLAWAGGSVAAGVVELLAGEPAAAERQLRPGYRALARMGGKGLLAGVAALLARALLGQDAGEEAEQITQECEELASDSHLDGQIRCRATRALVLARRGELARAEELAKQAVALASASEQIDSRAQALADQAEVLGRAGRLEEAATAAAQAIELYERKGNRVGALRTQTLLRQWEG